MNRRPPRRAIGLALLLLVSIAGCAGDDSPEGEDSTPTAGTGGPTVAVPCVGSLLPEVTVGETVEFDWRRCRIASLRVVDPFDRPVWSIEGPIVPPITFGQAPDGVTVHTEPAELDTNVTYALWLRTGTTLHGVIYFER
jgi:hypothetical protein